MSSRIVNFPSVGQLRSTVQSEDGSNSKVIMASLIAGGSALAVFGLSRKSLPGAALAAAGGYLIYRGTTGGAEIWKGPIQSRVAMTINRPVDELYRFWRDFGNLPQFMRHLESVRTDGSRRSHWTAVGPLNSRFSWDAEIIEEHDNQSISWQSLPNSEIESRGWVRFAPAPGGRGTEVRVELIYDAPAGRIGAQLAKLFGEEPEQQVREDLRRFKELMEAGEIPTIDGQPSGRRSALYKIVRSVHGLGRSDAEMHARTTIAG